jgi:Na+-driven multidrug efflux pump
LIHHSCWISFSVQACTSFGCLGLLIHVTFAPTSANRQPCFRQSIQRLTSTYSGAQSRAVQSPEIQPIVQRRYDIMVWDRLHFNRETLSQLLQIAVPMIVSQGTFAVMVFTDRYFLSQVSPTHMAAALGGGIATYFSFCFFSGLFSYSNALAAQYLGAGHPEKCPKVVTQGLFMTLGCLPFLAIISYFVSGIFAAMGHDPAQVPLERTYYLVLMAGAPITLTKICISSYFAGIGKTRVVMICDFIGMLINVPLSYAMVYGHFGFPELGILGAGVSTLIATFTSLVLFTPGRISGYAVVAFRCGDFAQIRAVGISFWA